MDKLKNIIFVKGSFMKNNLILFIVGAILSCALGILLITNYPSKELINYSMLAGILIEYLFISLAVIFFISSFFTKELVKGAIKGLTIGVFFWIFGMLFLIIMNAPWFFPLFIMMLFCLILGVMVGVVIL
ncbi:MAG: hypothetical protein AABW67_03905 [Nanoarchaeota archaeon]